MARRSARSDRRNDATLAFSHGIDGRERPQAGVGGGTRYPSLFAEPPLNANVVVSSLNRRMAASRRGGLIRIAENDTMAGPNRKLVAAVEAYFADLRRVRASGGATGERSYYPALEGLLRAVAAVALSKRALSAGSLAGLTCPIQATWDLTRFSSSDVGCIRPRSIRRR